MPALPFDLNPLIAEAKRRARRRRLLLAVLALVLAGVALGAALSAGTGGGRGTIPWLPTRPNLGPANPTLAAPCKASQLRAALFLQGDVGTLTGGISVTNRSSRSCALVERPRLSFAGATAKWRVTRSDLPALDLGDPLAPPPGSLRALAPGRSASVSLNWSNWCGRGSNEADSSPGQAPAAIVLVAPGGGRIPLHNGPGGGGESAPPCDNGAWASTLSAGRFAPYIPQLGPSSELPLNVRIVPEARFAIHNGYGRVRVEGLAAHRGSWLSYTVVLTNRSRRPFEFARSCPAYTEGFGVVPQQAYILNCRGVGSIAPHASVRVAMRVRVPQNLNPVLPTLWWTLAPHTWKPPQVWAYFEVRR